MSLNFHLFSLPFLKCFFLKVANMVACSGGCSTNYVNCCLCTLYKTGRKLDEITERSFLMITHTTWVKWLWHSGKKNAGERSCKFFC